MKKKPERSLALRELEPEPQPAESAPDEVDVAESVWDPWLLALARIAEQEEARPN